MSFDWLDSTTSHRKSLYRFVKRALDAKNKSISSLHFDLFQIYPSTHYNKTLQSGRFSAKKATPYFEWLKATDRKLANQLLVEIGASENQQSVDDESTIATSPNASQPALSIWLAPPTDETRFLFRSRSIPFIQIDEAAHELDQFCDHEDAFKWHVIHGPGGTGKSRLALEYALRLRGQGKWQSGFLELTHAKTFDWQFWQPEKPTFLIIDYAAREAALVSNILRGLALNKNLSSPVRLLLLERDVTGSWFSRIIWRGSQENHLVEDAWFEADGTLEPPEDVWPIIEHMCRHEPSRLPTRHEALAELERIDSQSRPLFAAFLGDAYARGETPRDWDAYALSENVLEHEKRYWEAGGVDHRHINLSACATATAGVPAEWLEELCRGARSGYWPDWRGNQTLEVLASIYGDTLVDDVPPLEPDILGEVFVLQHWKSASRYERRHFADHVLQFAPWFGAFLERLISDFPDRESFELLSILLENDLGEYTNTKPELLYNILTATATSKPAIAIEVYSLFEAIPSDDRGQYFAECLLDACHNLIVGLEELELDQALDAYQFQKEILSQIKTNPETDRTLAGIGLSLIAQFPQHEHEVFRSVLAETIRTYRRNRDNRKIQQEVCVALSNYMNLLGPEHTSYATRVVKLFRQIAQDNHRDDMEDAWAFLLFHMLLLLMLEDHPQGKINEQRIEAGLKKLSAIAPEVVKYKSSVLKLLHDDMIEN